ncbi:MAG: alpha/beta fold hydrolase [Ferruginibacter sp.]
MNNSPEKKLPPTTTSKQKWMRRFKLFVLIYCTIGIALYYLQEQILFHPKKLNSNYIFNFKEPFNELKIPFNKTDTVNMIQFYPKDSMRRGVLLYFHGNKNNVEHYAGFVTAFTQHGYEVWMPDYPGYGKSTGELTEEKLYNIAYEVQKMATLRYGADSIVVYGKSLGTALAAYAGSVQKNKLLILETPYYSIPSLFKSYAFMYPASMMSNYKLPTYSFLSEVQSPVIIFHGTGDWVVPYRSGAQLKKHLKKGDQFIRIPKGSHNNLSESPIYQLAIDSLMCL